MPRPRRAHQTAPQSVGFLLSALGWSQAQRFTSVLAPFGLEPREFAILRAVGAAEGQSQHTVCVALKIPPSRMVGLVDSLEEKGLVERRINASDRRARSVHLTAEGVRILEQVIGTAMAGERWLCEPLTAAERETLLDMLGRIAEHVNLSLEIHPDLQTPRPQPWPQGAAALLRARPQG